MGMSFLVFNAGSSSLKFSLLNATRESALATGEIDWAAAPAQLSISRGGAKAAVKNELAVQTHADAVSRILDELRAGSSAVRAPAQIRAIGHRIVHGGDRNSTAVQITPEVRRDIEALAELAPLHNEVSLRVIDAVSAALPRLPQFVAFDTAFHSTLP